MEKTKLNEINKEIQKCPETIFDTFDLTIDLRNSGGSLRDDIVKLSNLYGRINQLASNALFLYERAKIRKEKVESIAWSKVNKEQKITAQKMLVKKIPVEIDMQVTTLNDEENRVSLYFYIYNRGKDKVKEISTILDVGRTLLSWDKIERGKTQY